MASGEGTIEIPVIATDAATATLQKISAQLDQLTKAQEAQTKATQEAVTAGTLWANVYTKAADLVLKSITGVTKAFENSLSATIAYGDSIDGLSKRTGIATDSLQALKYAGEQAGIGFEAIAGAAKKLEVSLAKGGSKALNAGLKELKISAQEAAGPDGMEKIIQSLAQITDEGERAATATKLFGRSGPEIARVADELAKAAKEAHEFGLVINKDIIAAGDQTGDIMARIAQQIEAVSIKFGGAVLQSGSLQEALKVVSEVIADLSKFLDENSATITEWTNNAIIFAADALAKYLVPAVLGVIDTFQGIQIALIAVQTGFTILVIGINAVATAMEALANKDPAAALEAVKNIAGATAVELDNMKTRVAAVVASNSALHDGAVKIQTALSGYAARIRDAAADTVRATEKQKEHKAALEEDAKAAEKLAANLKKLHEAVQTEKEENAAEATKKFAEELQVLSTASLKADDSVRALDTAIQHAGSELSNLGDKALGELFEKLTKDAEAGTDAVKELATELKTDLIRAMSDVQKEKIGDQMIKDMKEATHQAYLLQVQIATLTGASESDLQALAAAWGELPENTGKATAATIDFGKSMQLAANLMTVLGISADSVTGKMFGFAQVLSGLAKDSETGKFSFSTLKASLKTVEGQMAAIAAGAQVLDAIGNKLGKDTKAGGALTGAAKGAQLGSVAGPYGAAIGAIVGGVLGFLKGAKIQKQAKEAGAVLGVKVGTELAKAIAKQAKDLKIDFKSAALLNITKAIQESGKDARTFGKPIEDLIKGIADGSVPAAEGMAQLSDSFDAVTDSAAKAGVVGDKVTRGIIAQAKAAGKLTDNMKEFQKTNVALAAKGVGVAFPNISARTEEEGKAQGLIFSTSFFAAVKEVGLVEAADMFRDTFDKLHDDLSEKFGPEFAQQVLGPVADILALTAEGTPFRAAAEGAKGLADALTGIANAGYLTQEAFNAFGVSAKNAYDQAILGGATTDQALQAILPLLQAQVSAAEEYGFQLDANTQALVDQATQAGYTFKKDPILQMADAMTKVAIALDKAFHLGLDFGKAMDGAADAANRTADAVASIPNTPSGGGGGGNGPGPPEPHFAEGGYVPPRPGGTRVVIGEGGEGEYVVPKSQMGPQSIAIDYSIQVDANGLSKAEAVEAIKEALKNGDRGLVLQLQKTNEGRR